MAYTIGIILIASIITFPVLAFYRNHHRYLREARSTGLKYVKSPVYFLATPWLLFQEALLPFLRTLPSSWTEDWLPFSLFYKIWHHAYGPFAKANCDTLIVTSPLGNVLWTCDPSIVHQIMNRRQDFSKPVEMMQILNVYGPTITAADGKEHSTYRKIAAPSFNENTYQAVWNESIQQTNALISKWTESDGQVAKVRKDTFKLALHVLSKLLFNKEMSWTASEPVANGHALTYTQAIHNTFKHNNTLFMLPKPLLNISPFKQHQEARLASTEFKQYMDEMKQETEEQLIKDGSGSSEKNSVSRDTNTLRENYVRASIPSLNVEQKALISPAAVYGNFFIFILAGHETTCDLLSYAIHLLACRPAFQKVVQADISSVFQSLDNSNIESMFASTVRTGYASWFNQLWKTSVGALMQETLRLYAPLPFAPKWSQRTTTVTDDDGIDHTIPANTMILINTAALHRNPKYWFVPAGKTDDATNTTTTSADDNNDEFGHQTPPPPRRANDVLSSWTPSVSEFQPESWLNGYTPPKGAYIPFSDGVRGCIGQEFARVEFCAIIARIFSEWSVELAHGSKGLERAERSLGSGVKFEMGVKMGEAVPLRFVKRDFAA